MPPYKLLDELRMKVMDTIWARKVTIERWRDPLTTKVNYRIRKL